jgi:hypothetical protein
LTGAVHNLSFEEYCKAPGINQSVLKQFLDTTPADVKAGIEKERGKPSKALRLGTTEHYLLLQPKEFDANVPIRPEHWKDYKKAEAQKWRDDHYDAGRLPCTIEERRDIQFMHDAVRAHRISGPLFRRGQAEVSIFFHDPEVGLDIKTRIDWLPDPTLIVDGPVPVVDLKTADDVTPDYFRNTIRYRKYYFQAFVNLRACAVVGLERTCALLCAVKSAPPWTVEIFQIGARWLEKAHEEYVAACRIYKECIETGVWPGSTNTINVVEPD